MASEALKQILKPREFIMRILWGGMTLTVPLLVGLAYAMRFEGQAIQPFDDRLRLALYLIAGSVAVLSLMYRRSALSEGRIYNRLKQEVDPQGLATNRETGEIDQESLQKLNGLTRLELKAMGLSGIYFTTLIVSLAINETVTMFGILLAILEQRPESAIPFAAVSLALDLLAFPRFIEFVDRAMNKYPQVARFPSGF